MYFTRGRALSTRERRRALLLTVLLSLSVIAGVIMFYLFPLTEYTFYPQCPTYALTKTHCPGCGTMRGVNGLLHGNVTALFTYNILALIALPFLIYHFFLLVWGAVTGYKLPTIAFNAKELILIAVVLILYWILRNFIPVLAPHG